MGCLPTHSPQHFSHLQLLLIEGDFTPKYLADIYAAANEWCVKTNSIASFDIEFVDRKPDVMLPTQVFIQQVSPYDTNVLAAQNVLTNKQGTPLVLGLFIPKERTILLVVDRLAKYSYEAAVIHELGHSLSLEHSALKDSVMYPRQNSASPYITRNDLIAFCNIYGCDADQLIATRQVQ